MPFALGPAAVAAGYRLTGYETIGSTNAEALARSRTGDRGDLWLASLRQTSGRGRRGRLWQTPSGNLAATLLLVTDAAPEKAATLGFVAGLAVEEAIRACMAAASSPGRAEGETALGEQPRDAPSRLRLKWPNDVLLGGAKLGGILLEAEAVGEGRQAVAVGIGVNVRQAPEGVSYSTASLAAAGVAVTAEDVFSALSDCWVRYIAEWSNDQGFEVIRRRWLARAAGVGEPISVAQGSRTVAGVFEMIDEAGRLILRAADGSLHQVTAGDVLFGTAATLGNQ